MRQPNRQMGLTAPDDDMYNQQALDQVLSGRQAQPRAGNPAARQMPDEPTASRVTPGAERGAGLSDMMGGNAGVNPGASAGKLEMSMADAAPAAQAPAAPKPLYGLEGFDGVMADGRRKLDAGDSPKYQVGRTLQGFDPAQGLTPEVIAALNTLGIGTFSGERDKLSVTSDDPRWNGVTKFDVGRDFSKGDGSTGSSAWSFQNDMPGQGGGAAPPAGNLENDMYYRSGATSDASSAVDPFTGQSTYQALMARLRDVLGGNDPERAALSQVLGK
jgi:hypothetical protein